MPSHYRDTATKYKNPSSPGTTTSEAEKVAGGMPAKKAETMAKHTMGPDMPGRSRMAYDLGDFIKKRQRANGVTQKES